MTTINDMRFRAWDRTGKKMYRVKALSFTEDGHLDEITLWTDSTPTREIRMKDSNDIVLMQYTDHFDDKENRICDGDILLIKERTNTEYLDEDPIWMEYKAKVEFLESVFWCTTEECIYLRELIGKQFEDEAVLEVIGNVYENSDLFEEIY